MRVRLPSGNLIVLVKREQESWLCAYLASSKHRGDVEFSGAYLRKHGQQV